MAVLNYSFSMCVCLRVPVIPYIMGTKWMVYITRIIIPVNFDLMGTFLAPMRKTGYIILN